MPKVDSADAVRALVAAMDRARRPRPHDAVGDGRDAVRDAARAGDRRAPPTGSPCSSWAPTTWPRSCTPSTCPAASPSLTGLGLALLAARATGKAIVDGVYNDVKDTEGFLAECRQGREMGFDGKTLIHPGQVAGANEAFAPSEQAVEDARGILQAWEDGQGSGVVTYNGRMVENLHVESAQRVLSMHEAIQALEADRA